MRRPTRLGLSIVAALLVVAGAYTAFWFVVAGHIESGLTDWAQSARDDQLDVSWQKIRVSGYPAAFRVDLDSAALRDAAIMPSPELLIPVLSGVARPWDFRDWRLVMPDGFTADFVAAGRRAPSKLAAQNAGGMVSLEPQGGWKLRLTVQDTMVEAGALIRVASADATVTVPPRAPRGNNELPMALGVDARQIKLPVAVGPLGDMIDVLDFAATVKGTLSGGNLADAVATWRDAGGTIEVENLRLKWGALGATATGTLALDQDLQPNVDLTGAIQRYDQVMTALVQGGQIRATDAGLARIALSMLAKTGPDGKPELRTSFTIRGGQMYLGPARLGRVPRLTWE